MIINRLLLAAICGIITLTALLLYLSSAESARMKTASAVRHGMHVELGAALYGEHCRSCHGSRGEGVGQLGPALADKHFFSKRLSEVGWQSTLDEYITATTSHGRMIGTRPIYAGNGSTAVMPPWSQHYNGPLREDEIHSLATFIENWEETAMGRLELIPLELPADNPSNPKIISKGESVFQQFCATCHIYRQTAPAQIAGPDLSEIATRANTRRDGENGKEYIRESIFIPDAYIVSDYKRVAKDNPCGAVISLTELTAVTTFLLQ